MDSSTSAVNPQEMVTENLEAARKVIDVLIEFGIKYGFQLIGALAILIAGWLMARWMGRVVTGRLEKRGVDVTLRLFIGNVSKISVFVLAVIVALGNFGISIAPMIAAVGALTFGVSLALQGPISNYGAGLVLILTRPFKVGNTVEIQGVSGVVQEIKLAVTVLSTADGEKVTIPNQKIVGQILVNSGPVLVATTEIGISYQDDPAEAIGIIQSILKSHEDVDAERAPKVGISAFADSSINLQARYWIPTAKYLDVRGQINLQVFEQLKKAGITIPFPQREVRLLGESKG